MKNRLENRDLYSIVVLIKHRDHSFQQILPYNVLFTLFEFWLARKYSHDIMAQIFPFLMHNQVKCFIEEILLE